MMMDSFLGGEAGEFVLVSWEWFITDAQKHEEVNRRRHCPFVRLVLRVVGLVVGVICDPISSLQFFYGIYVLYGAIQINAGSLGLKRTNFVARHSSSFFLSKGKQAASRGNLPNLYLLYDSKISGKCM